MGIYGELELGDDTEKLEAKLLLQKDVGLWTFAYNLVHEVEIEHAESETETERIIENTAGISYLLGHWRLGAETKIESVYKDWDQHEGTLVWAGPAVNREFGKHFWATLTPTIQLTNHAEEPDFVVRLIAGWVF